MQECSDRLLVAILEYMIAISILKPEGVFEVRAKRREFVKPSSSSCLEKSVFACRFYSLPKNTVIRTSTRYKAV